MAAKNFEPSLARVLVHEGGYVNHPEDPGGATMKGVTQAVYNRWRQRQGLGTQSVRNITDGELRAIYKVQYWDAIRGDDLPEGLDYVAFDFAVNSGASRPAKFLQRMVGVPVDGVIGEITLAAIRKRSTAELVAALCDQRLAWLRTLRTWKTFGKGWENRVVDAKAAGLAMARSAPVPLAQFVDLPAGKGDGAETFASTLIGLVEKPGAVGAVATTLAAGAPLAAGGGPVQWALAAAIVIAVGVGAFILVREIRQGAMA